MSILNKFVVLASLATASVTMAQPAASEPLGITKSSAKVSFNVDTEYHKFDGATDSVLVVTPSVTLDGLFMDDLSVGVAMPTIEQSDLGVGGFDVFANYSVWDGKTLGGDAKFTLGGGALVPVLDTAFDPDNVVPHLDAAFSVDWGSVSASETVRFDYIYDGFCFNPTLGAAVEEGVLTSETELAWKPTDWFAIGGNLDAQYAIDTESTTVLAGPSIDWTPSKHFNVEFGISVPVYQDVDPVFDETDWVAYGGFTVSF